MNASQETKRHRGRRVLVDSGVQKQERFFALRAFRVASSLRSLLTDLAYDARQLNTTKLLFTLVECGVFLDEY